MEKGYFIIFHKRQYYINLFDAIWIKWDVGHESIRQQTKHNKTAKDIDV